MNWFAFVSYAGEDKPTADAACAVLERAGVRCWIAPRDIQPGEDWGARIIRAIDDCKALVLIFSSNANQSMNIRNEIARAFEKGIPIFPVRIEDATPTNSLAYYMGSVHWLDALTPPIEQHLHQLAETLQKLAGPEGVVIARSLPHKPLTPDLPSNRLLRPVALAIVAALSIGLGLMRWSGNLDLLFVRSPTPKWAVNGNLFVGQKIAFDWEYPQGLSLDYAPPQSVLFELWSAADPHFDTDSHSNGYVDGPSTHLGGFNATRFWRIRAVDKVTRQPISDWSSAVRITQYDHVYDRIKTNGAVMVYMSNAEDQGEFAFTDETTGEQRGFDRLLAQFIVDFISTSIGSTVKMKQVTVPWTQLLDAPRRGEADFIISSITQDEDRKRLRQLDFSIPYFCTTYSLIYRNIDESSLPIHDLIAGSTVAVQSDTVNAKLAGKLAKDKPFEIKYFQTTAKVVDAVQHSDAQYAIVDSSFIVPTSGDRISARRFKARDFPASFPREEQFQEYAVGVLSGEPELLHAINDAISKAKTMGIVDQFFAEARKDFANTKRRTTSDIECAQ